MTSISSETTTSALRVALFGPLVLGLLATCTDQETRTCPGEPGVVTLADLLDQMIDPEHMTRLPSPWQCSRQFSSYNRASVTPDDKAGWFANDDRGEYLRIERHAGRKEYVMADISGPGAIVRLWSANPGGTLRVYIDGDLVISAPMEAVMRGASRPLTAAFAYVAAGGYNLYFPIPFQERAVVTRDFEEDHMYYHVGYLQFPKGTAVEPFSKAALARNADKITAVATVLNDPQRAYAPSDMAEARPIQLASGGTSVTLSMPGGGAIRELELLPSTRDEAALRQTVLVISFDGEEKVRAPLVEFFGSGPGLNPYTSLLMGVSPGGLLRSRWSMPFQESATITLESAMGTEVEVEGHVLVEPRPWDDKSLYFNARWQTSGMLNTRPKIDWNYVDVEGQGIYAGSVLNVTNPIERWWGEGDEKINVDGDEFPSFFGTGTEDYYGFAWAYPEVFGRPYHAQSRVDGPGNYGRTSLMRVHFLDKIPFASRLRFDMELWHWGVVDVYLDNVNYWYARPDATHNMKTPKPEDYTLPPLEPLFDDTPGASGWVLRDRVGAVQPAIVEPWCPADGLPGGCDPFSPVDPQCVLVRYFQEKSVQTRYELASGRPETCYESLTWDEADVVYDSVDCSGSPLSAWLPITNIDGALYYTPSGAMPRHLTTYSRWLGGTCDALADRPLDVLPVESIPTWAQALLSSPPYTLALQ